MAEHKRVVEIVCEHYDGPVIAGTGSNSTAEAIELTKSAMDAGADATLHITPYYNKPTSDGIRAHFEHLHDACDIPLILYNIPGRTASNVLPPVIERLARDGIIAGVKEASGNIEQIAELIQLTRDLKFPVLSGDDLLTPSVISLGGTGTISVSANIIPREVSDMVEACLTDNLNRARELYFRYFNLTRFLFLETNPIPVKAATGMMGLPAGEPRLPLTPITKSSAETLRAEMKRLGLLGD
jgi:4-hydroxy-tetrahydrodipicolinate synthase